MLQILLRVLQSVGADRVEGEIECTLNVQSSGAILSYVVKNQRIAACPSPNAIEKDEKIAIRFLVPGPKAPDSMCISPVTGDVGLREHGKWM